MRRRNKQAAVPEVDQGPARPERGPFDIEQIDQETEYLDLGSLMLAPLQ